MPRPEPILVVSDAHIPYHDKRAFGLLLTVAKALRPRHLYIIGDFVDFYAVSAHSKDPNLTLRLPEEIAAGNTALDALDALGATKKVYIAGNHEDRLQRYLQDKAPELFNLVKIPDLLHLKDRGWSYVPYKRDTRLGKVFLTHDVGSAGRNAVFRCLDTYQHSVITGHTHRLAYIVEGNATGEVKLSAQFGWLGDAMKVDYLQRQKVLKDWALGFGIGYFDSKTGLAYLVPVPIVHGGSARYSCMVNGTIYTA